MAVKRKDHKTTLKKDIPVTFFLVVVVLAVLHTNIFQRILSNILYKEGFSQVAINHITTGLITLNLCLTIIGILVVLFVAMVLVRRITGPISEFTKAVGDVSGGRLDVKIDIENKDEFGELARCFNEMTGRLQKSMVSLDMLEKEQRRFNDVVESSGDWIWETDAQGRYLYSNSLVEKILGYKPQEVVGKYFYDFFYIDDREDCKKKTFKISERKGILRNLSSRNLSKDNRIVFIETNGMPVVDKDGTLLGYRGINRDISQRVKIEENLLFLSAISRQVSDSIISCDKDFRITFVNKAAEDLFGYPKQELIGKNPGILNAEPQAEDMQNDIYDTVSSGKAWSGVILNKRKNNTVFICEATVSPMCDERGCIYAYIGIQRDITERKQAEEKLKAAYLKLKEAQEQLIQAEKLKAVGELASGIAHEVKNPLGILIQGVNYLEKSLPLDEDGVQVCDMMKTNIKRADDIVRALVDFSRASDLDIKREGINSILESSLVLIQHRIKLDNVRIVKELGDNLPNVLVDKGKMEQVFINILLNAFHAMPAAGTLYLRSYLRELKHPGRKIGNRKEDFFTIGDTAVIVEIEDTGTGIPEEYLKKIFDPFFTTKKAGEGSGLGLSVTMNIINMHKALLDINSREAQGTKVTITLRTEGQM
ncbi:MAG: PAS domain S-box protein [Candidatus Omnitrophota bacterium]